jgi:tRNA(His) 5'-end guanylyltransferase
MNNDSLGNRMKDYEKKSSSSLYNALPVCVRLDGKAFHSFTKGLKKPYDNDLSQTMRELTAELVKESGALVGFTQSDEISLLLYRKSYDSQIYFDGKRDKIISVLAATCSVLFNKIYAGKATYNGKVGIFDARAFNLPDKQEVYNYFLWRERDAVRNSLSMLAQHYFSHSQLQNKNSNDMHEMLHTIGQNWSHWPLFFKRGSYFKKVVKKTSISAEEYNTLPPLHNLRKNPELQIERSSIEEVLLNVNSISQLKNPTEYLFNEEK